MIRAIYVNVCRAEESLAYTHVLLKRNGFTEPDYLRSKQYKFCDNRPELLQTTLR